MSKIKIKNFGPIKEGYAADDGWMDIKKVTIFIGNQGSGKSTVAKLIATFMWMEKALIRGDIHLHISIENFLELLSFHRLENYLEPDTLIEYEGAVYSIKFILDPLSSKHFIVTKQLNNQSVQLPKIMYVPAERNFLSSIENINKVSNLIVGSLQNYSVEFRNAQLANKGITVDLPINDTRVVYDATKDENYLEFGDKRLKLTDASSGFHSIVPLHWVTQYLIDFVQQDEKKLLQLLSPDQTVRRNNELKQLNVAGIDEKDLRAGEKRINEKYICKYLVNIVEEPEQNLFPTSQRLLLNSLLVFNNGNNMLVMTTHSPYLINYITLAVKANELKGKVTTDELKSRLNKIVPLNSTIDADELAIYELDEKTGTIKKLEVYNGLPSDENKLNDELGGSNELFAELLEIQQAL